MNSKAPDGSEHFVADLASIFLYSAVGLKMCRQRALHGKRSITLTTLVGFLVSVDTDVSNQVTWFLKLFAAVDALMPAYTVGLQSHRTYL